VRTVLRALALRQMDDGQSTRRWSQPRLSAKAVWQIAKRYQQGGLDRGCSMRSSGQGSGAGSGTAAAHHRGGLLAAAEGRARWTVRLLTEEAIRRKLVPRVGGRPYECCSKPRSEAVAGKNVVRGEAG